MTSSMLSGLLGCLGWDNEFDLDLRPVAWTVEDLQRYPRWLDEIVHYNEKGADTLHPAVKALEDLIEQNTRIKLLACGMCDELVMRGHGKPLNSRVNAIRTYKDILNLFNHMLRVPPLWNSHMFQIGMEAAPFYLLLLDPMHTECGFAFFQDPEVNRVIRDIMNAWGAFLQSGDSSRCLDDSDLGWFGPEAQERLIQEADVNRDNLAFEDMYICDPAKPHHGFASWDDFFGRQFRDGIRPVASPRDDSVIANVCEAKAWRVAYNVKYQDEFWAKGGFYSLRDMLSDDKLSKQFAGGTVYQAYLSALAYHRWHSPVTGTIKRAFKIPGTYFSEPLNRGFGVPHGLLTDPHDVNWAQSYLSCVATRAVIFIEADNPDIGLMAVILIGMGEVSSCELTVVEGQRVDKGEQIGMFHFGGSTHCVLFRPGVEILGLPDPKTAEHNLPVRGQLARVRSRQQSIFSEKLIH